MTGLLCTPCSACAFWHLRSSPQQDVHKTMIKQTHKPTSPCRLCGLAPAGLLLLAGPVVKPAEGSRLACSSHCIHDHRTLKTRAQPSAHHVPLAPSTICAALPSRMCSTPYKQTVRYTSISSRTPFGLAPAGLLLPAGPAMKPAARAADQHAPATAYAITTL
jgi:hypothetical protein